METKLKELKVDKWKDRWTDRYSARRHIDGKIDRWTNRQIDKPMDRWTTRQIDSHMDRSAGGQTDRLTNDRWTAKLTEKDRQTDKLTNWCAGRQADRKKDRQTDWRIDGKMVRQTKERQRAGQTNRQIDGNARLEVTFEKLWVLVEKKFISVC
jgi:hypothetical protein